MYCLSLSFFLVGGIFSLLLIPKGADRTRNIAAHVPALLGSLCLVGAAVFQFFSFAPSTLTFGNLYSFIELTARVDVLSAFFLLIIGLIGTVASIYGMGYVRHYYGEYNVGIFGLAYNIFLAAMTLVVSANNAYFFLVAWELMSLASYALIIFEHKKEENIRAGLSYFIIMHLSAAAIFGVMLLLTKNAGSANFDIFRFNATHIPAQLSTVIFILAILGFGTKAGLMPFHAWLPDAHPAAPAHVSALMSGVMIKTPILLLLRVVFEFLPAVLTWWGLLLLIVGALSAFLAILAGALQINIKRLLAYSSVENIGLIFTAFGAAIIFHSYGVIPLALIALTALLFHTLNHALFKSLLFLSVGSIVLETGTANMEKHGGLIKRMPRTAIAFLLAALAISAFPPLNGFMSEWLLLQSLFGGVLAQDLFVKSLFIFAIVLVVLASGGTLLAFAKAFGVSFLARPRSKESVSAHEVPGGMQISYLFVGMCILLLGIGAHFVVPTIQTVAETIDGTTFAHLVTTVSQPNGSIVLAPVLVPSLQMLSFSALFVLVFLMVFLFIRSVTRERQIVLAETWDCGYPLSQKSEITGTAFSRSIAIIFKRIAGARKHITTKELVHGNPYFITKHASVDIVDYAVRYFYLPLTHVTIFLGAQMKKVQNGIVNAYVLYILFALITLVIIYL